MEIEKTKKNTSLLKKNIPIQSYCEAKLGITEWVQKGNCYLAPKMKFAIPDSNDYSSLVIDLQKNVFYRNSGKGRNPSGSIVNLIMNTQDVDFDVAVDMLYEFAENYNNVDLLSENKTFYQKNDGKKEFILPLPNNNKKRIFAYLTGKRKINKSVYNFMVDNGYLYQSIDHKCIFVSYNNSRNPIFACVRDTNWNERITYGVRGSDSLHGFYIDNKSKTLIVTEAVVDAMAYMSLLDLKGKDFTKYNYLALTGASKINCIKHHLDEDGDINKVILAFDNDDAGKTAYNKTVKLLKEWHGEIVNGIPKKVKDINDELIAIKTK